MKKLLTVLFSIILLTLNSQIPDISLRPVKEGYWVQKRNVTANDTFCNYTGKPIGTYLFINVPTIAINMGHAPAIYGYPNDGYIQDYDCGGAYLINDFQQIIVRDACTLDSVAGKDKSIFALQENTRIAYRNTRWNFGTQQWDTTYQWYYRPSVRESLLEEHPIDTNEVIRLANGEIFDDTTGLDLQYTSVGAADLYYCYDGNGVDITHLTLPKHYVIEIRVTPPPSMVEGTKWSNTYSHMVYIEKDSFLPDTYYIGWGANMPPFPECPPLCDASNPDPDSISVNGNDITVPSTGACDMNDLKIQIVVTKKNMPDQQYTVTSFTLTDGGQVNYPFLSDRDLQRMVRNTIPSAYSGGKAFYRVRVGTTILDLK